MKLACPLPVLAWFGSPSSTRTATAAALLILIISVQVGGQLIQNLLSADDTPESAFTPLMLWPPFVMMRFVTWMCLAGAFKEPITMDNWTAIGDGALLTCMLWMLFWASAVPTDRQR